MRTITMGMCIALSMLDCQTQTQWASPSPYSTPIETADEIRESDDLSAEGLSLDPTTIPIELSRSRLLIRASIDLRGYGPTIDGIRHVQDNESA